MEGFAILSAYPMLTLPHTLIAVALVKLFLPYPWLVLPLALLSHFIFDFFVPHWNPHLYTEFKKKGKISPSSWMVIFLDSGLALIFCLYILLSYWPNLSAIAVFGGAIFLSVLPDIIEIPYYFMGYKAGWLKAYVNFEHKHQSNGSFFWGIATQLITIAICLLIFFS